MTIISTIQSARPEMTRKVKVGQLYTFDGRKRGSEWVEAWTIAEDGLWPHSVVAWTEDPTVQDTLKIAKDHDRVVVIEIEDDYFGNRIKSIEEHV